MKSKILNIALLLTSFIGYRECGENNSMFLIEGEIEIIAKLFSDPASVLHPLILFPFAGQILLLVSLFQKPPGRWLTFLGMAGVGILLFFMFIISLISLNIKVGLSTLPFLLTSFLTVKHHRAMKFNTAKKDKRNIP